MHHYYIIAGSYDEMLQYTKDRSTDLQLKQCVWVYDEGAITEENPSGVFIGNWKKKRDVIPILNKLLDLSTDVQKKSVLLDIKHRVLNRTEV